MVFRSETVRSAVRRTALPVAAAALVLPLAGCGGHSAGGSPHASGSRHVTLTVLAAASLDNAFKAEAAAFHAGHPDVSVRVSFAGSQDLVAQIRQGDPADVLATADTRTMSDVKSLTREPLDFAKNRLTIATAPGDPEHLHGLKDLANPKLKVVLAATAVPVGNYSAKVLKAQHVTVHPVSEETSVTGVLSKVELGEADAGIVYMTDAKGAHGKVDEVAIPDAQNAIAVYPAAALRSSKNPQDAQAFVGFLISAKGQSILRAAGFQHP